MQEELLLEILNVVKRSETENKKAIKELKNDLKEFKEETRTAINGLEEKVDKLETNFDVHVVPDALYTPDYEELYRKEVEKKGGVKSIVDGNENEKGYYVSLKDEEEYN